MKPNRIASWFLDPDHKQKERIRALLSAKECGEKK